MDRKYWLFGGITAAVISGAYVFWTSSSKSNKKKAAKGFSLASLLFSTPKDVKPCTEEGGIAEEETKEKTPLCIVPAASSQPPTSSLAQAVNSKSSTSESILEVECIHPAASSQPPTSSLAQAVNSESSKSESILEVECIHPDRCPGLENLGNTCFLNSVLQGLASCSRVRLWLSDYVNSGHLQTPSLTRTLNDVIKVLNNETEFYDDVHNPDYVFNTLLIKGWCISPEEQDAHEMFHVLTQTITEETMSYPGVVPLFENPDVGFRENDRALSRIESPLPLLPERPMDHPFQGLLASQLECMECGYKNPVRYDHFDSLSLTFPQSVWVDRSLETLLYHYISVDTVSNVDCVGCSKLKQRPAGCKMPLKKTTFKKKMTIGKLPQSLVFHIQRCQWLNDGSACKRQDFVSFPEILDMSNYVYHKVAAKESKKGVLGGGQQFLFGASSEPRAESFESAPSVTLLRTLNYDNRRTQNGLFIQPQMEDHSRDSDVNHNGPASVSKSSDSSLTYRLCAVVVHIGNISSGHFITYRRSPNTVRGKRRTDKWLCCSDRKVVPANKMDVLAAEAYMLMYERL